MRLFGKGHIRVGAGWAWMLGGDACVALVEPSIIGGTVVQNQLTYPLHMHLNQELLPTLQFLQESCIILPDYNGVRVLGA